MANPKKEIPVATGKVTILTIARIHAARQMTTPITKNGLNPPANDS